MIYAKPISWNLMGGLVAPEWAWVWDHPELRAIWAFMEGGGFPKDNSGRDHNVSAFAGTTAWVQEGLGYALEFDGNSRAEVPHAAALSFPGNFSIVSYVRSDAGSSQQHICDKILDPSETYNWQLNLENGGEARVTCYDESNYVSCIGTTNLQDDAPHHIVGVRDVPADLLRIYADGVQENTENDDTTAPITNTGDVTIGDRGDRPGGSTRGWDGVIYYVAIYGAVLPPAAIAQWADDPFGFMRMDRRRYAKVAAAPGARPQGPLGHPLHGPFAGPIN